MCKYIGLHYLLGLKISDKWCFLFFPLFYFHSNSGGSEQSHREEDFYYTEVSSEDEETAPPSPAPSFSSGAWTSCSSTQSQSTPGHQDAPFQSSPLSQSAPSSVWQIHTEHLYQVQISWDNWLKLIVWKLGIETLSKIFVMLMCFCELIVCVCVCVFFRHCVVLLQACAPIQVTVSPGSPTFCSWTPPGDVQQKPQVGLPLQKHLTS